ncbi:MAG TPA: nuclear transport factor 2 family protein [Gaiellaceae bacterium]|nr:nuclear transport factor 2 family protein [Gaiellaceae bacterium]
MTPERLLEALAAWNTHDADRVVAYFADDGAYHASFGPELLGRSYVGRAQVLDGVRRFFGRYPDGRFEGTEVFVAGDRGASEWTFVATEPDGSELRVRGADLFEFDGDLIRTKNAFRKQPG